jgi:hypothetical protein
LKKRTHKLFRRLDRLISGPIRSQLAFFAFVTAGIFLLIFLLSVALYPSETSLAERFWILMHNFMDVRGYDDTDGVAPFLIFIANIMGVVFFGGLLVSVLVNIFEQRVAKVENGEVCYDFKGHVVIIGYDSMVPGLIRQLLEQGQEEALLQTVREVPEVRRLLFAELDEGLAKRVTLVSGNRTKPEDMEKLNVGACSSVFLLGEGGEADRDSQNIECLKLIASLAPNTDKPLRCHVLFDRQATFAAFQQQDILNKEERKRLDFVPFNFCDVWAKKVFVDCRYNNGEIVYTPLDREPLTRDSGKHVHLVILGMTNMGVALGLQAAHICHFPNFITKGIKTRITFIDENAKQEMECLKGHRRHLFEETGCFYWDVDANLRFDNTASKKKFTDFEFEFIQARFEQEEIQDYLADLSVREDTLLTIAAALEDQACALAAALYMPPAVYDSGTQILVRQELSYATVTMLSQEIPGVDYRKYRNLRPFGMFANAYDVDRAGDFIPMLINYTYNVASADEERTLTEFDLDAAREAWRRLEEQNTASALKASNRYCAASIPVKMRSIGLKPGVELTKEQIPDAARVEHSRWVAEKLLMGYRAPTTEDAKKITAEKRKAEYKARLIHNDICSYNELVGDDSGRDVRLYDRNIVCAMPFMLRDYERITGRKAWTEE